MQRLNEAYAVIGSPEKRLQYDLERLTPPVSPELVQVEKKPHPPRRRRKRDDRLAPLLAGLTGWIRSPLKMLLYLFALVLGLFLWSLITGEVSYLALGAIIFTSLFLILAVILKLRNPSASGK